jgi:spore maturation protein SpmB
MSIIVITGLLSNVLSILTTALSLVQSITGAEAAAIAIKDAILSITQAIGILNSLSP